MVEPGSVAIGTLATIAGISGYGAMKLNAKQSKDIRDAVNAQCKANDLLLKQTEDARAVAEEAARESAEEVRKLKEEVDALQTQKETLTKAASELQSRLTNVPVAQIAPAPEPGIFSMFGSDPAPAPAPAPAPEPAPAPAPEPAPAPAPAPAPLPPIQGPSESPIPPFSTVDPATVSGVPSGVPVDVVGPAPVGRRSPVTPMMRSRLKTIGRERIEFDRRLAERKRRTDELIARLGPAPTLNPADLKAVEQEQADYQAFLRSAPTIDEAKLAAATAEDQRLTDLKAKALTGSTSGTLSPPILSPVRPSGYIDDDGIAPLVTPPPALEPTAAVGFPSSTFTALPPLPPTSTPKLSRSNLFDTKDDESRIAFAPSLPPPTETVSMKTPVDARRGTRRGKPAPPSLPKRSAKPSDTLRVDVKPAPEPIPEVAPTPAPAPVPASKQFGRTPPTNIIPGRFPRVSTPYLNMGTQLKKGGLRKKKLRTRRGVKQNVRRSRGGKNRANRSASHTRRRA